MKNIFKIGLLLFMVTAFAACSTSYHYYTAGDDINLKKYKTFAVLPKPEGRKPNAAATDEKSLGAKLNYLNNNRYYNTPEAEQKIKSTTIAAMQSKGLVLQDTNPDLLVRYSTIVDRGSRTAYYPVGYGGWGGYGYGYGFGWGGYGFRYSPFWGGPWGGWGYGAYGVTGREHFKEGVLAIELIDNHTGKTVWIGYGAGELKRDPQRSIAELPQVVTDIIKRLPANI